MTKSSNARHAVAKGSRKASSSTSAPSATAPKAESAPAQEFSASNPKYPHIEVQLVGQDGNAYMILGLTKKAMKKGGCTQEQIDEYMKEAMSGDYDHLLQTTMKYVEVS